MRIPLLSLLLALSIPSKSQVIERTLDGNTWMLLSSDNSIRIPAKVPGNALTDLSGTKKYLILSSAKMKKRYRLLIRPPGITKPNS